MCEYMIAICLLTTPSTTEIRNIEQYNTPEVRCILQKLAVEEEVLDPREVRYILERPEDFKTDLALIRKRYDDLFDAPRVADCMRFPTRDVINDMLAFNRAYKNHLEMAKSIDWNKAWYDNAIEETDFLYKLWDKARDSRCEYYYVTVRRQALKDLNGMMKGWGGYYNGMPPHVPIWRFRRID